jgi:hypothetical protein
MRAIILTLALAGAVAACANTDTAAVTASPPTVSYRVEGADVAQANANAASYCGGYNMKPHLMSVQPYGTGKIAHYSCVASAGTAYPDAAYPDRATAPAPTATQCADWMHQGRPGGSDYHGPPVPGCPRR